MESVKEVSFKQAIQRACLAVTKTKVACKMDFFPRERVPRNYPKFYNWRVFVIIVFSPNDYELERGWKPWRVLTTKGQ